MGHANPCLFVLHYIVKINSISPTRDCHENKSFWNAFSLRSYNPDISAVCCIMCSKVRLLYTYSHKYTYYIYILKCKWIYPISKNLQHRYIHISAVKLRSDLSKNMSKMIFCRELIYVKSTLKSRLPVIIRFIFNYLI